MKIGINAGLFLLSMSAFSCTAGSTGKAEQMNVQVAEAIETPIPTGGQDPVQNSDTAPQEGTLKIYALDVTIGGKLWPRENVHIEQAELLKMDEKGPFPLLVVLKGPPIGGKQEADLRFWFSIPADYDGSPIRSDLSEGKGGEYVISFSEDNEAFMTWSAPWIFTWDDTNRKAINEPKTSGTVTLERFNQSAKRLRITFDALLFGANSDTATHIRTAKGSVELEFSVYDLQVEAEKMMKEFSQ